MSIKKIVSSLIDSNVAKIGYYNHKPSYDFSNQIEDIKRYDGNDDFYDQYEPVLLMFGHGDYVGSYLDMANMRYVETKYESLFDDGHIIYNNLGYGYSQLVIFLCRLPVARSGLFDDFKELSDYPIICEDTLSEIEQELLDEAWENWGKSDFESEIEKKTDFIFTETNWQDSLFWELLRHGDGSENFTEGTSMYIDIGKVLDDDDIIKLIVEHAKNLDTGEYEIVGEWIAGSGLSWQVKPTNEVLKIALSNYLI